MNVKLRAYIFRAGDKSAPSGAAAESTREKCVESSPRARGRQQWRAPNHLRPPASRIALALCLTARMSALDRADVLSVNGATRLDAHEREQFAEIVESSTRIVQRHQFYGWTQGIVQSLLAHEILICGVDDGGRYGMTLQHFSGSRYFREDHFGAVCAPRDGLLPRLMAEWQASGEPCLIGTGLKLCESRAPLLELVKRSELKNIAAHGVRGGGRGLVGFYGFSRIPEPLGPSVAYRAELVVPHVHAAFVRVLGHEAKTNGSGARTPRRITAREAEILNWIKEGKTNVDIAGILALSPWTVKNHVQTILKKFSAQTRGHAVARAISLGILDSTD
jgi:transcriptional regulator EpsA